MRKKINAADVEALRTEWRTALAAMEDAAEAYKQTPEYKAYLVAYDRNMDAHVRFIDAAAHYRKSGGVLPTAQD